MEEVAEKIEEISLEKTPPRQALITDSAEYRLWGGCILCKINAFLG